MKKEYHYQLSSITPLNDKVFQLCAQATSDIMPYQAGQYLELLFPDGSYQPFSIASNFDQNGRIELQLLTSDKDNANTRFLEKLKTNRQLTFLGAFGHCTLARLSKQPLILVTGGVGFSQTKAIMEHLITQKNNRVIHLYWGLKNKEATYLDDLLLSWQRTLPNFDFKQVFFEPDQRYVHEAVIADHPDLVDFQVIASGPKAMAMTARDRFKKHGLSEDAIYSDWFDFG